MNGLVSNYYNLTGQKNINVDDITLTGKFQGSNADYYVGITSNIQEQLNNSNTSTNQNEINTNIYDSISGGFYNISNIINNNQIYNNNINNYITAYLNSISGNIITINNTITTNNNNNNTIINNNSNGITSLSGILYGVINSITNNNYNISISNIIYSNYSNQNLINISLSGLINYNYIAYTNLDIKLNNNILDQININNNQNSNIDNNFNNLQGQITKNNKNQTQSSNGNTAGNIVNGIATFGGFLASTIALSALFSSVASLQAQITTQNIFIEDLSERLSALNGRVRELENQVRFLKEDVQDPKNGLLFRCAFINRNTINSDIFIYGTIQQSNINPLKHNIISSKTIFYSDIQVMGRLFDENQHITDLIQF